MAKDKKSFILYCDLIHTVEQMPSDKAGDLFKHLLRYVNDMNPETNDLIVKVSFEPIKQQLKRDLKKWDEKSSNNSESGRLGGIKSGEARRSKVKRNEAFASKSKRNEHVTVNDTVTVNVNDNDIKKKVNNEYAIFISSFNSITGKKYRGDSKSERNWNDRVKEGAKNSDFELAIKNCFSDEYHQQNPHFLTPEFITRSDKLQKYLNWQPKQQKNGEKLIGKGTVDEWAAILALRKPE